jgi:hypothetical protein
MAGYVWTRRSSSHGNWRATGLTPSTSGRSSPSKMILSVPTRMRFSVHTARMSKSPQISNDLLMLDAIAGDSSVEPVGAACQLRRAEHCRTQLGTFSGLFVANCPPSLAQPLRHASKIYELQRMDSTFANEFAGPKTVFFQDFGAGDGNRTHDIQLGKVFDIGPLVLLSQQFTFFPPKMSRDFLGTSCGYRARHAKGFEGTQGHWFRDRRPGRCYNASLIVLFEWRPHRVPRAFGCGASLVGSTAIDGNGIFLPMKAIGPRHTM